MVLGGVTLQFKEELLSAAEELYIKQENRRDHFLESLQGHAVEQIRNGHTTFRISGLKKEEERYLAEWSEDTNVKIRYISFVCFKAEKKYRVRQCLVNLASVVNAERESEGEVLIFVD